MDHLKFKHQQYHQPASPIRIFQWAYLKIIRGYFHLQKLLSSSRA